MDYKHELNSDDDFDCSNGYDNYNGNNTNGQSRQANPNGLSKAELRKTNKPIMEKRRRARINHCLNELKSLILEAMKKDPARHTKLEKADILEMTVKHLQSVQRQQLNMAIQTDPSVIHKFKTGFVECAEEVNRYISQLDGIDSGVRQRLTTHLNNCANSLEQIGSMTNFNNGYRSQAGLFVGASAGNLFPSLPQDLNNNNNSNPNSNNNSGGVVSTQPIHMGGLQLIPSRLPSGEFALIMPNTNGSTLTPATPFAWPAATSAVNNTLSLGMANPSHLNDYANTFRLSAFSKPSSASTHATKLQTQTHCMNSSGGTTVGASNNSAVFHQQSNAASSPPLSPVSSVSSHGDDSLILHNGTDYATSVHVNNNNNNNSNNNNNNSSSSNNNNNGINTSFLGVFSTPPPTSAETSFNSSQLNSSSSSINSMGASTHLQQQQVSSTSGHEQSQKRRSAESAFDSSDCSLDEPTAKKFLNANDKPEDADSMWRPW